MDRIHRLLGAKGWSNGEFRAGLYQMIDLAISHSQQFQVDNHSQTFVFVHAGVRSKGCEK